MVDLIAVLDLINSCFQRKRDNSYEIRRIWGIECIWIIRMSIYGDTFDDKWKLSL